jgi:phage gp16-like protein
MTFIADGGHTYQRTYPTASTTNSSTTSTIATNAKKISQKPLSQDELAKFQEFLQRPKPNTSVDQRRGFFA